MSYSIISLNIHAANVEATLLIPLKELEPAFDAGISNHPETLIERDGVLLSNYVLSHLRVESENGYDWKISIRKMSVSKPIQISTGLYSELIVNLNMEPGGNADTRKFKIYYDGIIHVVKTHQVAVGISYDWLTGKVDSTQVALGVIKLDVRNDVVPPFIIDLPKGSNWTGFIAMIKSGLYFFSKNIAHSLFLLLLLLPAPLMISEKKWTSFGGTKYTISRAYRWMIALITGQFIAIVLGAFQWVPLPFIFFEIGMIMTILIMALHVFTPILRGKEIPACFIFGLIHGFAFAKFVSILHLETGRLLLSVIAFSLGIMSIALFLTLIIIPWLIIICKNGHYKWLRISIAMVAVLTSIAWLIESISGNQNIITPFTENMYRHPLWVLLVLILLATASEITVRLTRKSI